MHKAIFLTALLCCSANVGATVINTFDGVKYEWLELTETVGMSRDEVELQLADPNSPLYGYAYPSRALVEKLLLSYASFDGLNGYHGAPDVVTGMEAFFDDFGTLSSNTGDGVNKRFNTVDGYVAYWDYFRRLGGYFGLEEECGGADRSCFNTTTLQYEASGNPSMVQQYDFYGWDGSSPDFNKYPDDLQTLSMGSFLMRVLTPVEIDVDPWNETNSVTPGSNTTIAVAVLGANVATGDAVNFDVLQINPATLALGLGEAPNIAVAPLSDDYDNDTNPDAAFLFNVEDTGILCDDTEVRLQGQTFSGTVFEGTDTIVTDGCDGGSCHP